MVGEVLLFLALSLSLSQSKEVGARLEPVQEAHRQRDVDQHAHRLAGGPNHNKATITSIRQSLGRGGETSAGAE